MTKKPRNVVSAVGLAGLSFLLLLTVTFTVDHNAAVAAGAGAGAGAGGAASGRVLAPHPNEPPFSAKEIKELRTKLGYGFIDGGFKWAKTKDGRFPKGTVLGGHRVWGWMVSQKPSSPHLSVPEYICSVKNKKGTLTGRIPPGHRGCHAAWGTHVFKERNHHALVSTGDHPVWVKTERRNTNYVYITKDHLKIAAAGLVTNICRTGDNDAVPNMDRVNIWSFLVGRATSGGCHVAFTYSEVDHLVAGGAMRKPLKGKKHVPFTNRDFYLLVMVPDSRIKAVELPLRPRGERVFLIGLDRWKSGISEVQFLQR